MMRKYFRKYFRFTYTLFRNFQVIKLDLITSIFSAVSLKNKEFYFLHHEYVFTRQIDWNLSKYGKLWTYNLTYFDYLHQEDMTKEVGIRLINDFIEQSESIKDGLEPFPISLRGINWIKFLSVNKIEDQKINTSLYSQYVILMDNIEYHILGNHLLENAFSLLYGAYYFQDKKFYLKSKKILEDELKEQILNDGAHFELSPMYHQIMLYRVLDCINLVQNNSWRDQELLELLTSRAEVMLGWLNTITFKNGNIPLLNDSTNHIAPSTKELNDYADRLDIKMKKLVLNESGYRKVEKSNYEIIVDVGNIGPDYIPGHAHSDTFNFELYIAGKPFIVDTGLSTYEKNARRMLERSTASHNTVELEDMNQSEVWAAFRVASRAKITNLVEKKTSICAVHNGYKKRLGAMHQREFIFNDRSVRLIDTIHAKKRYNAVARLHFYPGVKIEKKNGKIVCNDVEIDCSLNDIKIVEYLYSPEFNKTVSAYMIEIKFDQRLEMEIKI